MLSRVAENLFWISRYVERVENVSRLLNDASLITLDAAAMDDGPNGNSPLDQVLKVLSGSDKLAIEPRSSQGDELLAALTFDRKQDNSIVTMVARARENARATQETLSPEAWSQLNQLYLALSKPISRKRFSAGPYRFYERVKRSCVLFNALVDVTMPRSEAFYFLEVGRYLERVDMTSRVLNVWFAAVEEGDREIDPAWNAVYWTGLLRSCSAYEAFLKRHQDRLEPENIVQYLVLDLDFPRAMRFCVARCLESLRAITGSQEERYGSEAERLLGRLDSDLRYADVGEIMHRRLPAFVADVQGACSRIGDELQTAYFLN